MTSLALEVDFSWIAWPMPWFVKMPASIRERVLASESIPKSPRRYRPVSDYPALFRTFADINNPSSGYYEPGPDGFWIGMLRFLARFGMLWHAGTDDLPPEVWSRERWMQAVAMMRHAWEAWDRLLN